MLRDNYRNLTICCMFALAWQMGAGDAPLAAQSTTATLRGYVRDPAHRPIASARVVIVGADINAVADSTGCYVIEKVPPGTYTVRAAFVGYRPRQVEGVIFAAGDTVTKDFVLAETEVDPAELPSSGAVERAGAYVDAVPIVPAAATPVSHRRGCSSTGATSG